MTYKVATSKSVTKFLKTCDKYIRTAFFEKALILANDPLLANIKVDISTIVWEKNTFRLRIGSYRFLFVIYNEKELIFFTYADSRGWIYKGK